MQTEEPADRLVTAMTAIALPIIRTIRFVRFDFLHLLAARRRRQTTIDLISFSPYLLRDIGAEDHFLSRRSR
jgi:hypothetical protein